MFRSTPLSLLAQSPSTASYEKGCFRVMLSDDSGAKLDDHRHGPVEIGALSSQRERTASLKEWLGGGSGKGPARCQEAIGMDQGLLDG
jgi:hypothetical protein